MFTNVTTDCHHVFKTYLCISLLLELTTTDTACMSDVALSVLLMLNFTSSLQSSMTWDYHHPHSSHQGRETYNALATRLIRGRGRICLGSGPHVLNHYDSFPRPYKNNKSSPQTLVFPTPRSPRGPSFKDILSIPSTLHILPGPNGTPSHIRLDFLASWSQLKHYSANYKL